MTNRCKCNKDKKEIENKQPRPPTKSEVKANNHASEITSELLCDVSLWVGCIEDELASMNRGKVGRPYTYCDTMIVWIMLMIGYFGYTFRKACGVVRGMMKPYGVKCPSTSTIQRRIEEHVRTVVLGAPPEDQRIMARYVTTNLSDRIRRGAIDSTGLNLTQTLLWRVNKWGVGPKYKGWLKLHVLSDVDTNEIVAWILTEENVNDSPMMNYLVDLIADVGHSFSTIYADAAYESADHWKMLKEHGIDFVTKFKSNTQKHMHGSAERGMATKLWIEVGPEGWAEATGFGIRWKVECAFSDFKRLISELISAKTSSGMVRQLYSEVCAFNIHKQVRADILGITGNGVAVAGE